MTGLTSRTLLCACGLVFAVALATPAPASAQVGGLGPWMLTIHCSGNGEDHANGGDPQVEPPSTTETGSQCHGYPGDVGECPPPDWPFSRNAIVSCFINARGNPWCTAYTSCTSSVSVSCGGRGNSVFATSLGVVCIKPDGSREAKPCP